MNELLCENECVNGEGLPSLATHGRYCTRCWARLDFPLTQAGELGTHLLGMVSSVGGQAEDRIDSSRDAPLPLNQAAFDDASELYAMLVYWCMVWADHLEQRAPEVAKGAWRKRSGHIIGLPADIGPVKGGALIGSLARWLRNRLDTILETVDWADDILAFTDQVGDVFRMNARWPRIDRPAYSKMPCPRQDCGHKIAVYPPGFPGDARRIVCTAGHWYPEEEYEHLLLVFKQVRQEQAQVERTVKHLSKKYGIGR